MKVKVPKKYQKYIDETSIDAYLDLEMTSYSVWLNYGYCYDYENSGSHTQSYDTLETAFADLENVYTCNCSDCLREPRGTVVVNYQYSKEI
jgi:hypothetical protein